MYFFTVVLCPYANYSFCFMKNNTTYNIHTHNEIHLLLHAHIQRVWCHKMVCIVCVCVCVCMCVLHFQKVDIPRVDTKQPNTSTACLIIIGLFSIQVKQR